jgi:hypothetical protein
MEKQASRREKLLEAWRGGRPAAMPDLGPGRHPTATWGRRRRPGEWKGGGCVRVTGWVALTPTLLIQGETTRAGVSGVDNPESPACLDQITQLCI